jgi:hypothetical protein
MKEKNCDVLDTICDYDCKNCGHSFEEIKRRKQLYEANGLTMGEDGLYRLILPKKGDSCVERSEG